MIKLNHSNIIIPNILKEHTVNYPTPITINYFFGFGFTSGVFLGIQIFSGIFLAMFYVPDVNNAFESVEMIVNEIHYGWFFRNVHQTGASFFFMAVYIHIARSLYFKSFYWPNTCVWWSGLVIFLLMVATAFLGYVLPWSQMGFWAATVITNLFTAIPVVGGKVVLWIWGGYSVQNNTLKRFAILHYILPFVLTGLMGLHLSLLHKSGSSDSLLSLKFTEKLNFYPFFIKKDLSFISIIILAFMFVVCLYPTLFSEVDIYNNPVGSFVFVDQDKPVKSGDRVIAVNLKTLDSVFREYVIEGSVSYLKPLNTQYSTKECDEHTLIIGVIVGSYIAE